LFTVSVETSFNARHSMVLADGSREQPHHHNWTVSAQVGSDRLDERGVVMDFNRLKTMLDDIVAVLDNAVLDGIDYFQQNKASAEMVAIYIYEKLQVQLPEGVTLADVRVTEQAGCSAKFSRRKNRPAVDTKI